MSTELIRDPLASLTDPVAFIVNMGRSFAESTMFGCKTLPQGQVLALHILMTRQSPLDIMQTYHLVDGSKLSMRADAMLARFNERGGKHRILERTSEVSSVELTKDGNTHVFTLKWEDCKNEPFAKGKDGAVAFNYQTPLKRKQMLWARVTSDAVRAVDPGAIHGAYTPEELGDDPVDSPAGVIEGEVVTAQPSAAATPAVPAEPAKRGRKPKEQPTEAPPAATATPAQETPVTPANTPAVNPATDAPATVSTATQETQAPEQPAAPAAAPATPATSATLPQPIVDAIDMRDYIGARWDGTEAASKHGQWKDAWSKVLQIMKAGVGDTDEERLMRMDQRNLTKLTAWLVAQRANFAALETSRDLNAFANQAPSMAN